MRDDQHRAVVIGQKTLQPIQRDDVQVIGWLIQQEQVRLGQEQARQPQPRLLPAAERGHRPGLIHVGHAQAREHGVGVGLPPRAAQRLELGQGAVVRGQGRGQRVVPGGCDRLSQMVQPGFGCLAFAQRRAEHITHRGARREVERLRQVAQPDSSGRTLHAAAVGGQLAGDDLEQRGLAAAVRPDQTDPVAAVEVEVDAVQHFDVAEPFGDVADLKHGL